MSEGKTYFYLPEFYGRMPMQLLLHGLMQEYPECFYDNIEIGAVYGTFPGAIWNGGRTILGECDKEQMEYVLQEYNRRGIPVRFTFTNCLLEEKHLFDTFCNLIMELADNGMNEVLVNSPLLEAYIRREYPGYKVISSTTKQLRTQQQVLEELEKGYEMIVLYKAMNGTQEMFDLPHKEMFEILVDSFCMDDCPNSKAHYEAASKAQLSFDKLKFKSCPAINRDFYEFMENKSFITVEELYGRYREAGFMHFKLDGRAFNEYTVLESYMYYLVRPQERDRVRLAMLKALDRL